MTSILLLNAGSGTLKWSVLRAERPSEWRIAKEVAGATLPWAGEDEAARESKIAEVLRTAPPFSAIGHRVVHGGRRFQDSVRIDATVLGALEQIVALDRLHMRPALAAIRTVARLLPDLPQVAAFDTAFHRGLPEEAAGYGLPLEWEERYGARRYGFHGLSVDWSVTRASELLGGDPGPMLVCHLGSGCSVTAVCEGRSVDTTMGFSPLEGPIMATRSGSIDPGLVLHLLEQGMSVTTLRTALAEQSGWLGLSGVSADLRDVLAAADAPGPEGARPRLAIDRFCRSVRRAIGAMAGALGGAAAVLVFTGGVGENGAGIRRRVAGAAGDGITLDEAANERARGDDAVIARPDSRARVLVIHAREDRVLFREAFRLLGARAAPA